jgi:hypothetical protein
MNKSNVTVPFGVLLITGFYFFGALVLLAFLFFNPAPASIAIAERHGLPASTGHWILPVVAGIALIIAYGLFSLSKWGYVLAILYLIYFGSVNLFVHRPNADLVNFGNLLWSLLVILYLLLVRKHFFQQKADKPIPEQHHSSNL